MQKFYICACLLAAKIHEFSMETNNCICSMYILFTTLYHNKLKHNPTQSLTMTATTMAHIYYT